MFHNSSRVASEQRTIFRLLCIVLIIVACVLASNAQQRLLVVGGGKRPPDALKKFVEWSGGEKAHLMVITWATSNPDASFLALLKDLAEFKLATIERSPTAPLDAVERAEFINRLKSVSAIFFTGGDQNRIMDVLKDKELLTLIRERYRAGMPVGGTSAGAAVLSDPMMTGEADLKILDGDKVGISEGIGLLPGVIFDQHFLIRQRHNRLFGLISRFPDKLGIGIDENTAVLIENDRRLIVVGASKVMFIDAKGRSGAFLVHVLKSGDRFDLRKRKPVAKF